MLHDSVKAAENLIFLIFKFDVKMAATMFYGITN